MAIFLDSMSETFRLLKRNWRYIPLAIAFDIATLAFFGFGSSFLHDLATRPAVSIFDTTALFTPSLLAIRTKAAAVFSTAASGDVFSIASLVALLVITTTALYGIWLVFNGPSWYLAHKMVLGHKMPHLEPKFFAKFGIVTAAWFIASFLIVSLIGRLTTFLIQHPQRWIRFDTLQHIMAGVNIIFFYFLFISFALVSVDRFRHNFRKTFIYGIEKALQFLVMYAVMIAVLYLDFNIVSFLFSPIVLSETALTVGSIAIHILPLLFVAPFLTWARMYLLVNTRHLTK